jgi:hypothetical protein
MNLNFLSNSIVSFLLGEDNFTLEFISASKDFVAQKTDNSLVLNVRKDITANVTANENSFVLSLEKSLSYTVSFAIKFLGASFTKISDKKLIVTSKPGIPGYSTVLVLLGTSIDLRESCDIIVLVIL